MGSKFCHHSKNLNLSYFSVNHLIISLKKLERTCDPGIHVELMRESQTNRDGGGGRGRERKGERGGEELKAVSQIAQVGLKLMM